ncbi:hypothetical protein A9977_10445 [Variovorax sp. UMC13]|nr:hypothetical protein [Variovorax sp. UMC13]
MRSFRQTTGARTPVRTIAAALAAVFAMQLAVAQTTGAQAPPGALSKSGSSNDGRSASQLQRADEGMLRDIARANLAEIETGRIALDKSKDDQVRKFAQQMIDDHTNAMTQVQQLAQAKNVTLPDGPDMKHKTVATALKALSGDTFDKQYMSQAGVGDHKRTHDLLQKTQRNAKDADLKALASKMLPVVHGHLTEAEQIASSRKR